MEIPIETYRRGYGVGLTHGAVEERERIRRAVEAIADTPPNPSILYGEGYIRAIRRVLSLLKDGDTNG